MGTKKDNKKYGKYQETKGRVNLSLTQTAINALDDTATREGSNRSEVVERFARGLNLDVTPQEAFLLGE